MKIGKPIIPILWDIVELARIYKDEVPGMSELLATLEKADSDQEAARLEALVARGVRCFVCDKIFLPYGGSSGFCSLGCSYADDL